jgi:hypothetical protein
MMKEKRVSSDLLVGTINLSDLFRNKLSIPDFQRPYEWNERLVLKLFEDIDSHFFPEEKLKDDTSDFYLGSVLLNKKGDEHFEIIDGQQRLTTFLILDYVIDSSDHFLDSDSFKFYSNISVHNIISVQEVIKKHKDQFRFVKEGSYGEILDKIRLNVVITSDEQKAFQFFDSLNSKGRKLDTINILKSYHLRELNNEDELQKSLASKFDALNATVESKLFKSHRIHSFDRFVIHFWVKHNYWTKGNFSPIGKNEIELFLRDNSIRLIENVKSMKLFPSIRNMRNTEVFLGGNKSIYKSIYEESEGLNKVVEFNPMLPVQKGLGFFLSLEKLKHYFDILFVETEFKWLKKINKLITSSFNDYFIHLYYMLVLGYYVKFENNRLEEFAFEIEQILGNKFLYLQSARKESPEKIIRDELNILQHIYLNVEPKYLFTELFHYKKQIEVHSIEEEKREDGKDYVVIKFNDGKTNGYKLHSSRPKYLELASILYLSKETNYESYTNISWDAINEVM